MVEGAVSPRLLANLTAVENFYCPCGLARAVQVRASPAVPATPETGAASFLSMGRDSLSLTIRLREDLTHLLMLGGFRLRTNDRRGADRRGARELAERDGKQMS